MPADQKISQLIPLVSSLLSGDVFPFLRSNTNFAVAWTNLFRTVGNTVVVAASNSKNTIGADFICTGTNDDVTINAAIVAAKVAGGGTVLLREGLYSTTATILMKPFIRLVGSGWKTIVQATGTSFSVISNFTGNVSSPITDYEISNFMIDGTNIVNATFSTAYKGIYIPWSDRMSINKMYIYNCYATGIGTDFIKNGFIVDNYVDHCGRGAIGNETIDSGASGIGIGTGGYAQENVIIARNICSNNGKYGIFIEQQPGSTFTKYQIIKDNICYGNYIGLGARSNSDVIFAGNIAYNNAQDGLRLDDGAVPTTHNNNIRILGNILTNNTVYGLNLLNTYTNITVKDNDLTGNGTAAINNSTPASSNGFASNSGYNPVGPASVTVPASPFTYTAGNSAEMLYINGGTVSSIVKGGVTLAAASPAVIRLEPNQAVTVTYSSAPTMAKDVF